MRKIAYIFLLTIITMLFGCGEDESRHPMNFVIKNSLTYKIYYETSKYEMIEAPYGEIETGEKKYIGQLMNGPFIGVSLCDIKIYKDINKKELLYNYDGTTEELTEFTEDGEILFNMTEDKIMK